MLPRNRKEDDWFREWVSRHDATWQMITRIAHPGRREPDIIQALESPIPEVNGFRLIWFRNSGKCRRDAENRHDATVRAHKALEKLAEKLLKPRCRLKKARSVGKAVDEILDQTGAKHWNKIGVRRLFHHFRERPGGSVMAWDLVK